MLVWHKNCDFRKSMWKVAWLAKNLCVYWEIPNCSVFSLIFPEFFHATSFSDFAGSYADSLLRFLYKRSVFGLNETINHPKITATERHKFKAFQFVISSSKSCKGGKNFLRWYLWYTYRPLSKFITNWSTIKGFEVLTFCRSMIYKLEKLIL